MAGAMDNNERAGCVKAVDSSPLGPAAAWCWSAAIIRWPQKLRLVRKSLRDNRGDAAAEAPRVWRHAGVEWRMKPRRWQMQRHAGACARGGAIWGPSVQQGF